MRPFWILMSGVLLVVLLLASWAGQEERKFFEGLSQDDVEWDEYREALEDMAHGRTRTNSRD